MANFIAKICLEDVRLNGEAGACVRGILVAKPYVTNKELAAMCMLVT